jgi:hypothetical protein
VEGAQGGATLEAADISDLHLDGVVGDVRLSNVIGTVAGTHRNGEISVTNAGSVDLLLQNSETTLEGIRGAVRLSARNGRSVIAGSRGAIDVTAQNEEMVIREPAASVRVTGTGGSLEVEHPGGDGYVDMRGTTVDMTLGRAAAWTILTTDEPLRVHLDGAPAIRLDAIASDGGAISAGAIGGTPQTIEQETRLTHAIGGGSVVVALRNRRGAIVIGGAK